MKRIPILAIVIVIVIASWSAAWFVVSGTIRSNIVQLADADGQTTPRLTCDRLDIGGFPFWFDVTCAGMTVAQGDLTGKVAQATASALAYDPWQVLVRVTSPATLTDAFSGSKERLDWKNLEASGRLTGWRIARVSMVGDGLALNDTVAGDNLIAWANHAEFHLLDLPAQHDAKQGLAALRFYSSLSNVNAPGVGINDGKATLDGRITGLPDDIRTYGDPGMLKRWQAAGGKVELGGLKGADGADSFGVKGGLALDSGGHPAGQLDITSKGLVDRIAGMIPEQYRALVLGKPGPDGSYHQVLNLTSGLIFSGVVPLGTLPVLL